MFKDSAFAIVIQRNLQQMCLTQQHHLDLQRSWYDIYVSTPHGVHVFSD
jgi:hypothetical protein